MRACIDEETFNRFVEDSLEPEVLKELEEHVVQCVGCKREYDAWAKVREQLSEATDIVMPPQFKEKVMARVAEAKMKAPSFSVKRALAVSFIIAALLYCVLDLLAGPILSEFTSGVLHQASSFLYQAMNALGFDPAILYQAFGNIMQNLNQLFWVFAGSTLLMIIAFFALLLKGRTRANTN